MSSINERIKKEEMPERNTLNISLVYDDEDEKDKKGLPPYILGYVVNAPR